MKYPLLAALLLPTLSYAANSDWMNRSANGDLTQNGGARRLQQEISSDLKRAISDAKVKNVILLIGDGMGDSEITIARNYAEGAGGFFKGIDSLPFSGQYTHYSLDPKTRKPNYVTDSAASASAWSTGTKTYNGAISVDIDGQSQITLLELAKLAGLATGDVTTAEVQDATPAALYAHISQRKCYGPKITAEKCPEALQENGGLGSITEQLLNARPDLTLGGGRATFEELASSGDWQGKPLFQQAQLRGYRIVEDLSQLQLVDKANQQQPLLGLFAPGNLPVRWLGPKASYHGNLTQAPVTCQLNPLRTTAIPTLAQMTEKAINLLKNHPKGFFLQVEGASIDKEDHAANPCGQIGETVDLDEAVQQALAFAKADGHTLVIVTADHAHSSQLIYPDAKAPGLTQALQTREGGIMGISYGNSEADSMGHTGTQLRIAAYGPQAANVTGLSDQTDLHFTIARALGLR